jgi:hypothetical protein
MPILHALLSNSDVIPSCSCYIRECSRLGGTPYLRDAGCCYCTMGLFSLAPIYELSVCVSGNATVLKWLRARVTAGHGGRDTVGFPFPSVASAEDQGAFLGRTSRAMIGSARTFFYRSFRRKGGGQGRGGREINYRLGPERSLGAKDG